MMAEGGSELSDSVKESDYFYDFPCFPCERDGRNVKATKHCADCNENLCVSCLTLHNRFATTRGHKVLDQVQNSQGQTKQLPSQRCSKHGGKIIDIFCPEHDTVGCSTCMSIDHSSCKDKEFIPDLAAGIKTSKELKHLETEMNTLIAKLDSLKKLKGDNIQRLKQDKDVLKKQIQSVRKKMNEHLDKMEKALLQEAEKKFKEKIDVIHASLAELDDMLVNLKQAMVQVKSNNNDADIFVSFKMIKQKMFNEIYPLHARVEKGLPERSFELHKGEVTSLIMEGKRMFASIKEKYTIHGEAHKKDINIRLVDDKNTCKVHYMCVLPDGRLVMSDYNNNKLKTLDQVSNHVSTLINLPDCPTGICLVDNTHLAVALVNKKKVQFVSFSGHVTLKTSFSVGDRCRGVAHCDGLLYVCCGGFVGLKEGRGHVEVYNCKGELLRHLYEDVCYPEYVSVINDDYHTTLYIADRYKGVQVRRIDGAVKHQFPNLNKTNVPFCLIGTNQICIGEYATGNVYVQTNKGKRVLIEKKDMKGNPVCLYFVERASQLFVTLNNCNTIKVFDMTID